jgi:hypothetical protein
VSVTIGRPDIITGQPERKLSWPYIVQMVSGGTIPFLEVGAGGADFGARRFENLGVVAEITEKLILGLDTL